MPNCPAELPFNVEDLIAFVRKYGADRCYFLTVTLKPKLYKFSSVTQLELSNNILYNELYKNTLDYWVVSEHTGMCNVHYHSIVTFRDEACKIQLVNKLKKNKELGFIKLDSKPIQNMRACCEYMTKELYNTMKVFTSVNGHRPHYWMNGCVWRYIVDGQ
jgi:hypothetical protein